MDGVVRVPLEGGAALLVEGSPVLAGPVKAGRAETAMRELPTKLKVALGPVAQAANEVLEQLSVAGPQSVEIEFGVDLSLEAGAVVTKSTVGCHLVVKMSWQRQ